MFREVSKTEKAKTPNVTYTWNLKKRKSQMHRNREESVVEELG